jgi:hypothetical protein
MESACMSVPLKDVTPALTVTVIAWFLLEIVVPLICSLIRSASVAASSSVEPGDAMKHHRTRHSSAV